MREGFAATTVQDPVIRGKCGDKADFQQKKNTAPTKNRNSQKIGKVMGNRKEVDSVTKTGKGKRKPGKLEKKSKNQ